MRKNCIFLILSLICSVSISAKKPLDHSVYDSWKSLTGVSVTDDGRFALDIVQPQEGDAMLQIRQLGTARMLSIPRAYRYSIAPDQRHLVALIKPPFAMTRKARIKKTKEEKMPKDSLCIVALNDFSVYKTANVKDFKLGKDFSDYVAYALADSMKVKDKADNSLQKIVVRHLTRHSTDTIAGVTDYLFSRNGKALALAVGVKAKDTTNYSKVLWIDLTKYVKKEVSVKKTVYKQLALSESGDRLAFLATADSAKVEGKRYSLHYFIKGNDSATVLVGPSQQGMPAGWSVCEHHQPEFSKKEGRLFFGIAPLALPKDTTVPDFEKVLLNVWHWQDTLLQPQQMLDLPKDRKKSYLSFVDLKQPGNWYQLADKEITSVEVSDEKDGQYALGRSSLEYRMEGNWDTRKSRTSDLWVFDLTAHSKRKVKTALTAAVWYTPKGNYIVWYNFIDRKYYSYAVATGKEVCLTEKIPVNLWDEKNDRPQDPSPYGIAAWFEDESLLLNDRYDEWKVDVRGIQAPINLTAIGKEQKITFRYLRTDPESRFIKPKEQILLSAFDNVSKQRGFYVLSQGKKLQAPKRLVIAPYSFSTPVKAKKANVYLYTKSNFSTSPDLYVTNDDWQSETRLTDINPQQHDYNWGTAELIAWTTYDGKPTEGIVYKPEDFDPAKKYPLMVYYYEKHADGLYSYFPPVPSRSIINISFYCSRGYIVFTPDIQYSVGHPGESAYNSVVSGVETLCRNPWIDRAHMAIQGQSWGGYQTAYLITRTNMFAAAGAGAPVSNMFSAYGGIRWESGRSRQIQYEHEQSRIGKTPWEAPGLYTENSPLFAADKVNTPLLMTHNDKDGAVPWYQGIEYYMALRRLGKPVWLLQYNGEAHNLVERKNAKDLAIRLQQFFDHYLKGAPEPVWMKYGISVINRDHTLGLEYAK